MSERTINFTNGIWQRSNHPLSLSIYTSLSLSRSCPLSLSLTLSAATQCWRRSTARDINRPRHSFVFMTRFNLLSPPSPVIKSARLAIVKKISSTKVPRSIRFRIFYASCFVVESSKRRQLPRETTTMDGRGGDGERREEKRSEAKQIDKLRGYDLWCTILASNSPFGTIVS